MLQYATVWQIISLIYKEVNQRLTKLSNTKKCLSKNLQVRPSALFNTTSSETSNNTTISIPLLGGGD